MLNKLKESLLNKELTILDMDNTAIDILEVQQDQSILNGDTIYYAFENMSHSYNLNDIDYNIEFELIENTEYKEDNIIKVINIDTL